MPGTDVKYAKSQRLLHWLVAVIVIVMLTATFYFDALPKSLKSTAYNFHKLFGILVLLLMVMRLYSLCKNGRPSEPERMPKFQKHIAHAVHFSLYILLFLMPITGWVFVTAAGRPPHLFGMTLSFPGVGSSSFVRGLFHDFHLCIAWILIVLISMHVLAAFKHYFLDKDGIVQRML